MIATVDTKQAAPIIKRNGNRIMATGENTSHQDHVIIPVSLRPVNKVVSNTASAGKIPMLDSLSVKCFALYDLLIEDLEFLFSIFLYHGKPMVPFVDWQIVWMEI